MATPTASPFTVRCILMKFRIPGKSFNNLIDQCIKDPNTFIKFIFRQTLFSSLHSQTVAISMKLLFQLSYIDIHTTDKYLVTDYYMIINKLQIHYLRIVKIRF